MPRKKKGGKRNRDQIKFHLTYDQFNNPIWRPLNVPKGVETKEQLLKLLPAGVPVDMIEAPSTGDSYHTQSNFTREGPSEDLSPEESRLFALFQRDIDLADSGVADQDELDEAFGNDVFYGDSVDEVIDFSDLRKEFEDKNNAANALDNSMTDREKAVQRRNDKTRRQLEQGDDVSQVWGYNYNKHFRPVGVGSFFVPGVGITADPEMNDPIIPAIPVDDAALKEVEEDEELQTKMRKHIKSYVHSEASGLDLPIFEKNAKYNTFTDDFLYPLETGELEGYEELEDNFFQLLLQGSDDENDDIDDQQQNTTTTTTTTTTTSTTSTSTTSTTPKKSVGFVTDFDDDFMSNTTKTTTTKKSVGFVTDFDDDFMSNTTSASKKTIPKTPKAKSTKSKSKAPKAEELSKIQQRLAQQFHTDNDNDDEIEVSIAVDDDDDQSDGDEAALLQAMYNDAGEGDWAAGLLPLEWAEGDEGEDYLDDLDGMFDLLQQSGAFDGEGEDGYQDEDDEEDMEQLLKDRNYSKGEMASFLKLLNEFQNDNDVLPDDDHYEEAVEASQLLLSGESNSEALAAIRSTHFNDSAPIVFDPNDSRFTINTRGVSLDSDLFKQARQETVNKKARQMAFITDRSNIPQEVFDYNKRYLEEQAALPEVSMAKVEKEIDRAYAKKKKERLDVQSMRSTLSTTSNVPSIIKESRIKKNGGEKAGMSAAAKLALQRQHKTSLAAQTIIEEEEENDEDDEVDPNQIDFANNEKFTITGAAAEQKQIKLGQAGIPMGVMERRRQELNEKREAAQKKKQHQDATRKTVSKKQEARELEQQAENDSLARMDDIDADEDLEDEDYDDMVDIFVRRKDETPEEKRARKQAMKEDRRKRRQRKKQTKIMYKQAEQQQKKQDLATKFHNPAHKKIL